MCSSGKLDECACIFGEGEDHLEDLRGAEEFIVIVTRLPAFLSQKEVAPLVFDDPAKVFPAEPKLLVASEPERLGLTPQIVAEAEFDRLPETAIPVVWEVQAELVEYLVGLLGRALITTFRALIGKSGICRVVEVLVDATADVVDHVVDGSRDRLDARRAAKIAFVAFGMIGAEFLQAIVVEAGTAHEVRIGKARTA
jgi:hypothetical protein